MMKSCSYKPITDYIEMIECDYQPFCKEQKLLCNLIKQIFEEESISVNTEQAEKYFSYQKYFPYDLFPWEKFIFTLHNCVYRDDGFLRFPDLFLMCGRGTGKNGFLSFEDFCLLTPTNGIPHYDIDIFAMSEDQARVSFNDIYEILESKPKFFKNFFYWNKEYIQNLATKSVLKSRTTNFKTGDSRRPGKVDFDEYHCYENYKLINVSKSGLGKVPQPRTTIITTEGYVREGPLDDSKNNASQILNGIISDNGTLPVIYKIDEYEEVFNPEMWIKANPSLPYRPALVHEMHKQFEEFKKDPIRNMEFIVKRMNWATDNKEICVTEYENIKKTNQELQPVDYKNAILCFDYASSRDFAAVGVITRQKDKLQFNGKMFVLKGNKDLPRIKAPLEQWEQMGLLEWVDGADIPASKVIEWAVNYQLEHNLTYVACALDYFRYSIMKKELDRLGFESGKDSNLKLVRPSDIMQIVPTVCSLLENGNLICGNNPAFRWCVQNMKKVPGDKRGNEIFEKIEPKSRKTDLFQCFVAGATLLDSLPEEDDGAFDLYNPIFC